MTTVGKVAEFLDCFAPRALAESWDNTGLLVGDRAESVSQVMTCLTVTPPTVREAVEATVQMIVTHHPVLFKPTQRLTSDDVQGAMLCRLIGAGIAVYSPHTSFDNTTGGINELLAGRLELSALAPMRLATGEGGLSKVVVYVPEGDLEGVSRAMFDAGAGRIGEYSQCSFRTAGQGTFFGSESAKPTVGQSGRREQVDEWRLEAVCPHSLLPRVLAAVRAAHSYEEPACDVYPLMNSPSVGGVGRYGDLGQEISLKEFARKVRKALTSRCVQVVGDPNRKVRRVGVGCGAASEFISDANALGCDVLVTGEAGLHRMLEAEAAGVALVLAGHFATEQFAMDSLADRLRKEFADLQVFASRLEQDPAWLLPDP